MLKIEVDKETDGRFIARCRTSRAYGQSREEAISKVEALALHAIADRIENGAR
jgi:hypothetical protein